MVKIKNNKIYKNNSRFYPITGRIGDRNCNTWQLPVIAAGYVGGDIRNFGQGLHGGAKERIEGQLKACKNNDVTASIILWSGKSFTAKGTAERKTFDGTIFSSMNGGPYNVYDVAAYEFLHCIDNPKNTTATMRSMQLSVIYDILEIVKKTGADAMISFLWESHVMGYREQLKKWFDWIVDASRKKARKMEVDSLVIFGISNIGMGNNGAVNCDFWYWEGDPLLCGWLKEPGKLPVVTGFLNPVEFARNKAREFFVPRTMGKIHPAIKSQFLTFGSTGRLYPRWTERKVAEREVGELLETGDTGVYYDFRVAFGEEQEALKECMGIARQDKINTAEIKKPKLKSSYDNGRGIYEKKKPWWKRLLVWLFGGRK